VSVKLQMPEFVPVDPYVDELPGRTHPRRSSRRRGSRSFDRWKAISFSAVHDR